MVDEEPIKGGKKWIKLQLTISQYMNSIHYQANIQRSVSSIIHKRKNTDSNLLRWVLVHNASMDALHEHPLTYLVEMGYRGKMLKFHLQMCLENEETTMEKVKKDFLVTCSGLFLYSSLIWGPVPGGFGSGNKEQYLTKNMIIYSVLAYFLGMSGTYILLCMDYLPWTIAENPFTSELDVLDLVAVMLVIFGTRVRLSAFKSLKEMFTAQVTIKENHKLITTGPYKTIRHPSYLGTMMALVGLSILLHMSTYGYLIEAAGLMLLPLRIKNEERALKKEFGKEYEKWKSHTYYMIPGVI